MFRGAQTVNLDGKGRIAIPTRYRPEIRRKIKDEWFVRRILISLACYFIH